jgi:hypothetical protein
MLSKTSVGRYRSAAGALRGLQTAPFSKGSAVAVFKTIQAKPYILKTVTVENKALETKRSRYVPARENEVPSQ